MVTSISLNDVAGLDHVRRAVEVALCGKHEITLVPAGNIDDARTLSAWLAEHGHFANVCLPCLCGNLGSHQACYCSVEQLQRYYSESGYLQQMRAEIIVSVTLPNVGQLLGHRQGESDAHVLERIERAQARPPTSNYFELDEACQRLAQAALRQLGGMSSKRYTRLLAVARTIADLAGSDQIGVSHLAEAIQYRPRMVEPPQSAGLPSELSVLLEKTNEHFEAMVERLDTIGEQLGNIHEGQIELAELSDRLQKWDPFAKTGRDLYNVLNTLTETIMRGINLRR